MGSQPPAPRTPPPPEAPRPDNNKNIFELAARATLGGFLVSVIALTISVLGLTGTVFFNMYQLHISAKTQQIAMLRELALEFNADPLYKNISMSIEACQHLYNGNKGSSKGRYDWEQINHYLNFLDNLGFYQEQKALTPEMVQHFFGALIIEAYENKELQKYAQTLQTAGGESHAFKDFQAMAMLLETNPDNLDIIRKAQTCP